MQVDDKRKNSNNEREREEACMQSHRKLCKQVTDQCMQVDKSNKLNHNDDVKTAEMIVGNSAINSKRQDGNYKSVKDVSVTNQIEKSKDLRSQV